MEQLYAIKQGVSKDARGAVCNQHNTWHVQCDVNEKEEENSVT